MAFPVLKYKSSRRSRRPSYRLPGMAPEIPGDSKGLDASTGSAGQANFLGGVGLKGIPSPVPELQTEDLSSINPGLVKAPVYDLVNVDAARSQARAQAPYQKLDSLKQLKDLSPMASASPEVAQEIGAAATGVGLPATGQAIARIRAPRLPGQAPTLPGQAPMVPGDPLQEKAQAYGHVITELMKKGVPVEQATQGAHQLIQQARFNDLQSQLAQTVQEMRMERPFTPTYQLAREAEQGVLSPEFGAEKERARQTALYDVKTDREPTLIAAKNRQELADFNAATPSRVARASAVSGAQQDQATRGANARKLFSKETDLEYDPQIVAAKGNAETDVKIDRQTKMNQIALEALGDTLGLKQKDLQKRLELQTQATVEREKQKTPVLVDRKKQMTAASPKLAENLGLKAYQAAGKAMDKLDQMGKLDGLAKTPEELLQLHSRLAQEYLPILKKLAGGSTVDPTLGAFKDELGDEENP